MSHDTGSGGGTVDLESFVDSLTLDQKLHLVHGHPNTATGYVPAQETVDLPDIQMSDGPVGVDQDGPATAFPASIAQAATWDTELVASFGEALGRETAGKDQDVILAPGFNIARVPHCGRNFEYFGEDPYLSSRLAVAAIEGIQSNGVLACAKHYVANSQETDRKTISADVSERALREIYFPAFRAAVKEADVASVMAAYNKVNGTYCSEHEWLLEDVLRDDWGFDGFVVSDWWATHSTVPAALAGLDQEMPNDEYFGDPLHEAVGAGDVPEAVIDEKVRRILGQLDRFGLLDEQTPAGTVGSDEHRKLARRIATDGAVLLKNEADLLPLDPTRMDSLAVVGNAHESMAGGGGSSSLEPRNEVSPLEGIQSRVGNEVTVRHVDEPRLYPIDPDLLSGGDGSGVQFDVFGNRDLSGDPAERRTTATFEVDDPIEVEPEEDKFISYRWTATVMPPATGSYVFELTADDRATLSIDGETVIVNPNSKQERPVTTRVDLTAEKAVELVIETDDANSETAVTLRWNRPKDPLFAESIEAAREADATLVCVQEPATESLDRRDLHLGALQDDLIEAVADATADVAVLMNTPGAVRMPWLDGVPAILELWYPGQEDGHATADIVFGDVNPSGKLPVTFGARAEDYPANTEPQFPGVDGVAEYSEELAVGYRHFDAHEIDPLFPFGHGESYTTFEYEDIVVDPVEVPVGEDVIVSVTIENVGGRAGAVVPQCYLTDEDPPEGRPPRELAAFGKITLAPGQRETVDLEIDADAFRYWAEDDGEWKVSGGQYTVTVGRSSRDRPLSAQFDLVAE